MFSNNQFGLIECDAKLITGNRDIDENNGGKCLNGQNCFGTQQVNNTESNNPNNQNESFTIMDNIELLNHSTMAKKKRIRFYRRIGGGYYSNVYKAYFRKSSDRRDREKIIVKIVDYERCTKKSNYENELNISFMLKDNPHPNVVNIVDIYDRPREQFWILMERDTSSRCYDLDSFLRKLPERLTGERLARELFGQLTNGLRYLHQLNIVHRDIKPENILIKETTGNGLNSETEEKQRQRRRRRLRQKREIKKSSLIRLDDEQNGNNENDDSDDDDFYDEEYLTSASYCIKLIDFGFGKIVEKCPDSDRAICMSHKGTLEFMAPELLVNCFFYDAIKADIYSIGVILYLLLFGASPFRYQGPEYPLKTVLDTYYKLKKKPIFPKEEEVKEEEEENIVTETETTTSIQSIQSKPEVEENNKSAISTQVKELIEMILQFEPKHRPTLDQILQHEWVKSDSVNLGNVFETTNSMTEAQAGASTTTDGTNSTKIISKNDNSQIDQSGTNTEIINNLLT